MKRAFFQAAERLSANETLVLDGVLGQLAFNAEGLIPVITQDVSSKDVLMQAWMNRAAVDKTIATGFMTYWSRSRGTLWVKGETSGHFQTLVSMHIDCDGDSLLCLVAQQGVACHTGRRSCFYLEVDRSRERVTLIPSSP